MPPTHCRGQLLGVIRSGSLSAWKTWKFDPNTTDLLSETQTKQDHGCRDAVRHVDVGAALLQGVLQVRYN